MPSRFLRPMLALALLGPGFLPPLAAQAPAAQAPAARDWAALVGEPPQPGSPEGLADLSILLWLQGNRTALEVARAEDEVSLHPGIYSKATGVDLESKPFARTRELLQAADADLRSVLWPLKLRFGRPRPYEADARIHPAVPLERSLSYPSGHAARGILDSTLLALLAPARKQAILDCGRQVGSDRSLGGVHYPSDVAAGQRLAAVLVADWLQDPAHARRLEEVRAAEWAPAAKP